MQGPWALHGPKGPWGPWAACYPPFSEGDRDLAATAVTDTVQWCSGCGWCDHPPPSPGGGTTTHSRYENQALQGRVKKRLSRYVFRHVLGSNRSKESAEGCLTRPQEDSG